MPSVACRRIRSGCLIPRPTPKPLRVRQHRPTTWGPLLQTILPLSAKAWTLPGSPVASRRRSYAASTITTGRSGSTLPLGFEAAQSSVGGGGRYDVLFEMLGGQADAVGRPRDGFRPNPSRPRADGSPTRSLDAFIIVADTLSCSTEARCVPSPLRRAGLRADAVAGERSVKAQFEGGRS